MKVSNGQQFFRIGGPIFWPATIAHDNGLTLWTMAIPTGVIFRKEVYSPVSSLRTEDCGL